MKKSHKILLVILALIFVAGIAAALCWDMLVIYLMPRSAVTNAANSVYAQLQQRFEGHPMRMAVSYLDPNGKQTADMELYTSDPVLGELQYDMQVQVEPGCVQGSGSVYTGQNNLELSFYADSVFMAISSENLLQGSYYGITYDTFLEDIRSIPLLSWMIGDSVLQSWNQDVLRVQQSLEKGYQIPKLPKLEEKDLQKILLGLAATPADVEKVAVTLQNQIVDCHRVSFKVDGELAAQLVRLLLSGANIDPAVVSASFYLNEQSLVLIDANLNAEDFAYSVRIELGKNCLYDPIGVSVTAKKASDFNQTNVHISSVYKDGKYVDQWHIDQGIGEKGFSYEWEPTSGIVLLTLDGAGQFALNLTQTEKGLSVRSDDLSGIYRAVTGKSDQTGKTFSGIVTVRKGANIAAPQYKNLNQWSMEDFLILLEGIGSLIGLRFS